MIDIRKILSLFLTVIMVSSSIALIDSAAAKPVPAVDEIDDIENNMPDLQVTDLSADTPQIYLNQNNGLTLSLSNQGTAMAQQVVVVVTDIKPDLSEEIIASLQFGAIKEGKEKTRNIDWFPEERGIHYLELNISARQQPNQPSSGDIELENIIQSSLFSVTPPQPLTEHYSDWIVDTVIDPPFANVDIVLHDVNLIITETGHLTFGENVNLFIENSDIFGNSGIEIQEYGIFEINGGLKTTKLDRSTTYFDHAYKFINRGTIDFTGANVFYTHGPPNTSLKGGIQNLPGSTCIINNCDLLEADTHTLYIDENVNVDIKGSDTHIGSLSSTSTQANGHGIFVKGATPVIEDVTVQYQKQDGIHIENSVSEAPIQAADLYKYASSLHDYRLTCGPDNSVKPVSVAANGDVLVSYINQDSNEIYFKKTSDYGMTWAGDMLIQDARGTIMNMDMDGDQYNLALVWEERVKLGLYFSHSVYVVRSADGGESWSAPINVNTWNFWTQDAVTPSVTVSGNNVYIAYKSTVTYGGNIPQNYIRGITLAWGPDGSIQSDVWPNQQGEYHMYPKVTADGDNLYLVDIITDGTSDQNDINLLYSTDGGSTITNYGVVETFSGDISVDTLSIEAKGNQLYIAWSSNENGDYDIYGLKGKLNGVWQWSSKLGLVTGPGDSMNPVSAVDSDYNWQIVWQDDKDGTDRIYAHRFDASGDPIGSETCMTPDTSGATMPSISIDSSGYAYLAWEDDRAGDSEIYIKKTNQLTMTNLMVFSNEIGISLVFTENCVVSRSEIHRQNSVGLSISNSHANLISQNTIHDNPSQAGIKLEFSGSNSILDNNINTNSYGINMPQGVVENIITDNIIDNNNIGIAIGSNSLSNSIFHNSFTGNTISSQDNGNNRWDSGYPTGGNYWFGYAANDAFSGPSQNLPGADGIYDSPYPVSGIANANDNYPLVTGYVDVNDLIDSHWKLDEDQNAAIAIDSIGNNDGNIMSEPLLDQPGFIGSCFDFPSRDDMVSVPDDTSLNFPSGQSFTIIAWINTLQKGNYILDKTMNVAGDVIGYSLAVTAQKKVEVSFNFVGAGVKTLELDMVAADGKWHFVSVVRDGDALYLYVDKNVISDTGADGDLTNPSSLVIGNDVTGAKYFDGYIDDVMIIRDALPRYQLYNLFYVDSDNDGMSNVFEYNYGIPTGGWQDKDIFNDRYGLIIVTDHYTTNPNWYWNDAWYQYETLLDYGLDNDHIYFVVSQAVLNSVAHWGESYVDYIIPTQDAGFTSSEIKQVIISAYQDVGTQMNSNDCLYQIWIGHGGFFNGATLDDLGFGIDEYAGNWVKILHTSGEFESSLLDNIPNYAEMILLFQPCHSGGAAMNINKVNTVIISSAKIGNVDEGWITHWRDGFSPAYANADGFVSFYNGQVFGEVYGVLDGELSIYEGYVYAAEKMHIQTNGGQQSFVSDIPDGTQGKFYWYFSSNPPPSGENGHISYSIYFGELRLPY